MRRGGSSLRGVRFKKGVEVVRRWDWGGGFWEETSERRYPQDFQRGHGKNERSHSRKILQILGSQKEILEGKGGR